MVERRPAHPILNDSMLTDEEQQELARLNKVAADTKLELARKCYFRQRLTRNGMRLAMEAALIKQSTLQRRHPRFTDREALGRPLDRTP